MKIRIIVLFNLILTLSLKAQVVTGICTLNVYESYNFGDTATVPYYDTGALLPLIRVTDSTYNVDYDIAFFCKATGGTDPSQYVRMKGVDIWEGDSTSCEQSYFFSGDVFEGLGHESPDFNFITRDGKYGYALILDYSYQQFYVLYWKVQLNGSLDLISNTAILPYSISTWATVKQLFR